ncbi:hypothetical protein [Nitrosopumilus adriaticus]|uniref:Uncharacterized protein n=1 Tax=Nitrosopumilus adriaticus TaxID=1580092 RepID=A0A0D5C2J0_9ARCH|nr:hypothetical protein [Nitrosopumilus adriaticus]AJW70783.1 hypothetical protein NADRNF5_1093 [Nitrosopumilus adriaticus]
MTELLSDREKLVSVYGFTKYYSDESIPDDFIHMLVEQCVKKNTKLNSFELKKEIEGLDNFLTFTIESTMQNIEKSILYKRVISDNPKPYTIGEYLKENPREALIFVYSVGKGIEDSSKENNIPFDFQNYMKKFDDWVFYESFSEEEFEKIPKDTQIFLDTVIEEIKRKPKSGEKK